MVKAGYKDYTDIKFITEEDLEALPGMGPVSQIRVLQELDDFKSLLYKDLIAATKDAADRVGVEKVIEALEELK